MLKIIQNYEVDWDTVTVKTDLPPQGVATTEEIVSTFKKELKELVEEVDVRGKVVRLSGRNILSNSAFAAVVFLLNGASRVVQEQAGGSVIPIVDESVYIEDFIPLQPGLRIKADIEAFGGTISDAYVEILAISRNKYGFKYNIRDISSGGTTMWIGADKIKVKEVA